MKLNVLVFTVICSSAINICNGQRTRDKMYEYVDGSLACFRRLNGTHQIGCSTARGGTTGVVHFVESSSIADLNVILKADNTLQYIPVLPLNLFTLEIVNRLQSSPKISGIVVHNINVTVDSYTQEETCPNSFSNLGGTCDTKWNQYGTGLLRAEIKLPVFMVKDAEDLNTIRDCFDRFNNYDFAGHADRSLCALELDGFMFASIDTPTCLRRSAYKFNINPVKVCDPLSDRNVWASIFPVGYSKLEPNTNIKQNMKYIIVSARLDTTSLFQDIGPGARSPLTGIVTLLSLAKKLKGMLPKYEDYDTNVLFFLLNGEAYDYIGSQRIVYDMQHDEFPSKFFKDSDTTIPNIHLGDISMFIELSQITNTSSLFVHRMHLNESTTNFVANLKKHIGSLKLVENKEGKIPPASLHTFLKALPSLPGLILADHADSYVNFYYNSLMDNAGKLNFRYVNTSKGETVVDPDSIQMYVRNVSDMLAKSLYQEITKDEFRGDLSDDSLLVNELFHCYLQNVNCTVHQAIQRKHFREETYSLYVGVGTSPNILTSLMGLTLAWFTGDIVVNGSCPKNMTSELFRHFNMSEDLHNLNVTKCFRCCMNFTEAESPAFQIEDYDWNSGEYSTWSESVWKGFSVRLFLRPSRWHEIITVIIGAIVFVLSSLIVYFFHSRSSTLFVNHSTSPTRC